MKSFEWWLKQKRRVQKKYVLFLSKYYSPKEKRQARNHYKRCPMFRNRLKVQPSYRGKVYE